MSRSDISAGRAYVSLYVKQDAFSRGLADASAKLNQFGSSLLSIGSKVAGIGGLFAAPLTASVKIAANFEEAISKFGFVFKDATTETKKWADSFATQVGRSRLQIVEFLADTQALVSPIGFDDTAATEMSKSLTNLAVDLASFNNRADSDVLRDLHAALVGSSETMLKYGVIANETAVKQELLNSAIDPKAATNQDKVLARYNIIMRGTVAAQGDATRTANSLTNMTKALKGTLSDAAVEIGTALIPALSKVAENFVAIIRPMVDVIRKNPEFVMSFATVTTAVAASGAAIAGLGIVAKVSAVAVSAAGAVYRAAAIGVATAWKVASLAFAVLTIKARIASEITSRVWGGAIFAITNGFKILSTVASAAVSTAVLVTAAAIVATAWVAGTAAIAVAMFGLGTVMSTVSAIVTTAWTASGGIVSAAWLASAGAIGTAWTAMSGVLATLSAVAVAEWVAGSGIIGTAMAVINAAFAATGATGTISATLTGLAWSAAGVASSAAWSAFTFVLGSVFTMSNLLTVAAFAVQAAWATAWAVISGPILPLVAALGAVVAAVGAIAAAAAYATVKGSDFSRAWGAVTGMLGELMSIAKQVGGVLMTAFAGGDYDIAFRAAMAGIKLATASVVDAIAVLWSEFWSGLWNMTKKFLSNFIAITYRTVKAIAMSFVDPFNASKSLAATLSDLTKGAYDITLGINTDVIRDKAKKELDALEKELAARNAKREAASAVDQKPVAGGVQKPGEAAQDVNEKAVNDAKQRQEAFDRETDAIRQQIIALKQGEEAAERFRLKKEGFTDAEINNLIALQAQRDKMEADQQKKKEQEARLISRIQDFADADADKKKLSSAEIAAKEKAAIEKARGLGAISEETRKKAIAEADIRKAERDHQAALKKFRGDDKADKVNETTKKGGAASSATFSARSLIALGQGGQSPQLRLMADTKKAILEQTKQQKALAAAQIVAIKNSKLKHA